MDNELIGWEIEELGAQGNVTVIVPYDSAEFKYCKGGAYTPPSLDIYHPYGVFTLTYPENGAQGPAHLEGHLDVPEAFKDVVEDYIVENRADQDEYFSDLYYSDGENYY